MWKCVLGEAGVIVERILLFSIVHVIFFMFVKYLLNFFRSFYIAPANVLVSSLMLINYFRTTKLDMLMCTALGNLSLRSSWSNNTNQTNCS